MKPSAFDIASLRTNLKRHRRDAEARLRQRHPQAVNFLEKRGVSPGKIREHATRLLTSGALAGALVMGTPLVNQALAIVPSIKYLGAKTQELQEA
ncbi:MAG: hypothetical protein ACOY0S_03075, partial [Patescibacteria group bacterium]